MKINPFIHKPFGLKCSQTVVPYVTLQAEGSRRSSTVGGDTMVTKD